ncbi:MAG: hypothetical protein LBP35_03425 [Candidatus Ancillula trichonymphae]|jgi:hypothetical protein|nr:hypothetical protein [Candidatus Ancillula trichonymphae]
MNFTLFALTLRIFQKQWGSQGADLVPECVDTDDDGNSLCPQSPPAVPAAYSGPGTVIGWGDNTSGQLGTGHASPANVDFASVVNLTNISAVTGNNSSSYALTDDGKVLAWGDNTSGQLGNGKPNLFKQFRPSSL